MVVGENVVMNECVLILDIMTLTGACHGPSYVNGEYGDAHGKMSL